MSQERDGRVDTLDWRELTGAGAKTPPGQEEYSRSEGDMRKNSFRRSRFPRLFKQAVSNDDGTAITENAEKLLEDLIAESKNGTGLLGQLSTLENLLLVLSDIRDSLTAWTINDLIARGYAYHITIGAFSSPITGGGAGTIIDQNQPEGVVSVPGGYTLIPIRFSAQCQVPLLATDSDEVEILLALDSTADWAGDGTATAESPLNLAKMGFAPEKGDGAPLQVASAFSADMTRRGGGEPTLDMEIARKVKIGDVQGVAATSFWTALELLYEPLHPPYFNGPCALYLYWGGTVATTGFAQMDVAVVPVDFLDRLRL